MIFDSHCHLQFPQYDKDREEMINRALGEGVFMVCVGTDYETSKSGIELAKQYGGMWATVGLHPNDAVSIKYKVLSIKDYEDLLENEKVVAIGEVGLDYYRTPETGKQKKQKEVFEQFIDLAIKTKKPMILHFRDSSKGSSGRVHKDALEMLPKDLNNAVSHSFTGNIEEVKAYINRGMYIGFNGIITFARQYDEVVRYVPLENILLETDAPYLAPESYRGQRNESMYIKEVAQKVAELKQEPLEKVVKQTTENCKKLFSLL